MDMSIFQDSVWASTSLDKKIKAIQELENQYAKQQGRPKLEIATVKPTTADGKKTAGAYDYDNDPTHIQINEDMLNDPRCKFEVLDTVIHEGRHAYQRFVVDNNRTDLETEQTILLWKENEHKGCYNTPDYDPNQKNQYLYRYQATERDAYDYAKVELNRSFSQIHGEEKNYQKYRSFIDAWDTKYKIDGIAAMGPAFEQKIDQDIHKTYEYLEHLKAGIPSSVLKNQNSNATTNRERLLGDAMQFEADTGVDFYKALASHIKGNEEMYARVESQRNDLIVVSQVGQQDKSISR